MVLQSMMIADCVDYEEHANGTRPDGVFFSGQSFLTKLAAGLAVMIQGLCYMIVGYETDAITSMNSALSSGLVTFAEEYKTFAMIMFFLVSIPPAIGMILSIIPMLKYELTDKEHTRILDELNAKRLANAEENANELQTNEQVDAVFGEGEENAENINAAVDNADAESQDQPLVMPVAECADEPVQETPAEETAQDDTTQDIVETPAEEVAEETEAQEIKSEEVVEEAANDAIDAPVEETAEEPKE